jgi:hypothetical protein
MFQVLFWSAEAKGRLFVWQSLNLVIVEASDKDEIEFIKLLNVNLNIPNTNGEFKVLFLLY